jgi:threonine/homoserine/homoserine lactone efflux protein
MNPALLGFLINTTNPMVIGFWIPFFSSAVQHCRLLGRHYPELLLFAAAIFAGSLAWFAALSTFVIWGRRYVGRLAYVAVSTVCNAVMILVGTYFVLSALGLIGREMP